MMKILFIITGLGTGGAERQVCDLADSLSNKGYEVQIVSLIEKKAMGVLPKNNSIVVNYLDMTKKLTSFFSIYFKLRKLVKDFQPDVIHSHMFHANILARLLKIGVTIPKLISTAHSKNEGGRLRMSAYRLTNFLSDISTNVSQEAADEFVIKGAIKPEQMIVVSNGIDVIDFSKNRSQGNIIRKEFNISDNTYIFVAIGRLTNPKDYPNLLNAFSLIVKNNDNVVLLIVGVGELEEELKLLCSKLELNNKVHFLGLRRDISNLMNVADTYVMSSYFEGLPLVIGEAMACENIVVSTDCGGVREILGDCGFLVPIRNSEMLAEKMQYTMTLSPVEREDISKRARERIQRYYSLDAITQKWLELYRN